MSDFFRHLFSTDFMPHGFCIGRPEVIWLHQISDIVIAISYFLIPLALLYIVRVRRDLVYPWLFLLFGVFILSCGATHVLAVYVLWHPVYRLDGVVKAITAAASLPTALILVRMVPKVRLLPSAQQLREHNEVLQAEILVRKRAEEEVRRLNQELERRVADRTQKLQASNDELSLANAELARTIAEREQAQEALNANQRFLDSVTGIAPVLLYVFDLTRGQNVWTNAAAESILGYTPEELVAMGDTMLPSLMHPEHASAYASHRNRLHRLAASETLTFEYRMRRKDGTWRWLISHERAFDTAVGGEVRQIAGAAQDITERKLFEEALRESEVRFRELADNISQFAWMADQTGAVYWFNQRWYNYTGAEADRVTGSGWANLVHPDHADRVLASYRAAVRDGLPWEETFPLQGKDDRYRWFLSRALAIRDDSQAVVRWFGTNTDITEQRKVETELRRANSDLEQFAYSASHDLKEPLRNVTIYSQVLARHYAPLLDEKGRGFLGFITEGASRMEALISELLVYTAIGTDNGSSLEAVDSQEIFDSVRQVFEERLRTTGGDLRSGPLPKVRMRAAHLTQLFQNLIGNGLKYCQGRSPSVRVSAEETRGMLRFAVEDNGIGIENSHREVIFGIFRRLHSQETYPGTGMGLAICRRIVDSYGGQLWVESEPGHGSTFYFTVPA